MSDKKLPAQDALEIEALALFKQEWTANGFSTTVPIGGDKMPRRNYALTVAAVVEQLVSKYEVPHVAAVVGVLLSVLGNASQLGAKLLKEKWLTEAGATETADALIAQMQARLAKK